MNLRRYVLSAFIFALMPFLVARSEDAKVSAGNLEKEVARDTIGCGVDPSVIGREGIGKKTKILLRRQFHSPHLPEQYCYWCSLTSYAKSFWYTSKALQIVDDFDKETLEELFDIKLKRVRKAQFSYLIALEKTRQPFTKVEMSCDARNPIKNLVVGVDADQLALKEDEILKMFGNECERGAASASHGGSSCTYLIYRTKTCSSTFAFRGEGNKYLTALMVDRN
ncbi:MAG TPA: hypothetical protein EYN91_10790 [Candidatus Melainabacteria bacterium]|nr:hypothetical protein [Candidatus Melainabacteria bacterium]HIN64096.1 hypothetical protein [Candidatus Obscuribacterales bacterium]